MMVNNFRRIFNFPARLPPPLAEAIAHRDGDFGLCYNSLEASQNWINNYYENKTAATMKWLNEVGLETDKKLYATQPEYINFY